MDAIADLQLAIRQVMPDAPAASRPVHFQMSKGHVMDFGNDLTTITCGLGWDTDLGNIDLDVSCVMFDMNGDFLEAVFFGNLSSVGKHSQPGAVVHSGDNLTGEGAGDDEQIVVYLQKVGDVVAQIFFCLNIYTRGRNFANVANPYVRVVDSNRRELCVYRPREVPSVNGLLVCRLARDPRTRRWGFHALGVPSMGSMYKDCLPEMNKLFFTKTNALLSRMPTQPLDAPGPPPTQVVVVQGGGGAPYAQQQTYGAQQTFQSQPYPPQGYHPHPQPNPDSANTGCKCVLM
uniref:TerD domain-containing protein n=1 Tax=Chromera velia CCMP2878 TaxID=1169474 RepID=A0A0G4HZU9_9ALVE|eukprot:Cvel_34155.t1-p1 / transcript=Cvel_34155.t1 / gene=Cvel_34155 / organism=Chromera_velia_CCMP2878 / gene_product=Tellurium resistance protein TerZ, putative / transcript_product=Tellurium resistance protein TerZ, putative / location=Cvel_scaffold5766:1323-3897(-) / protein_length=288 / sequence_SO=supercontig / SO=protein_coding / is_pseudo=false